VTNIDTQRVEFCREVRRRRLALSLTLEQLAERSGLTPNYIGAVELGKRDPSLSTVLALARGFKVPPGEMLGSAPGLTPAGLEAAGLFEGAPPEIQSGVLSLLRAVGKRRPGR
jgi:transcriptional regulator with XRE-family HTH domain